MAIADINHSMTERPILFQAAMVRAILDGSKTQTRRIVKPQPPATTVSVGTYHHPDPRPHFWAADGGSLLDWARPCPYGAPGDRLWVREAFIHEPADYCWEASVSIPCRPATTIYRADSDPHGLAKGAGWKPSIHMPRSLSRIALEITGVCVDRLRDISEADAWAEGMASVYGKGNLDGAGRTARYGYQMLWDMINGAGSWTANPWVWVVEFRRVEA